MLRWRCFVLPALGIPLSRGFLGPLGVTGAVDLDPQTGVSQVASKLSVSADASTLEDWQRTVEDDLRKAKEAIADSYPVPATDDSLHKWALFSFNDVPDDTFRFLEKKAPTILDFVSVGTGVKRMVQLAVLLKDGLVLEDPVRNADQLARTAEALMKELSSLSSKVQKQTASLIDGTDRTLEAIEKAAGLLDLQQVQASEAQAAGDYARAKKIYEELLGMEGEIVKKTAAAGLLLAESAKMVASMGPEANYVKERLRELSAQFASQVDSNSGDAKTALRHLSRGLAVGGQLDDDYRRGLSEVRETRSILETVQGCRERLENFKISLKQLALSRSTISRTVDDVRRAHEQGDVSALNHLMDRLEAEKAKVALIGDAGKDLVGELAVKKQALQTILQGVTSATSRRIGQILTEMVTRESTGLKNTLRNEVQKTQVALAAAMDEASQFLAQRLKEHATAVADNEGWLQTTISRQKKLVTTAQTKQAESAAAKQAADQFKTRLLEDIAEVRAKVAAGESDWKALNTAYSLEARGEAAAQLRSEAEAAAQDASRAAAMLHRFVETFNKEASEVLKKLSASARAAAELAQRLKRQRAWLYSLQQQLEGTDADTVEGYADTAGRGANEAEVLAAKSSAMLKAVESRVQDVRKSLQQTERVINSQKDPAEGGDSSGGSSSTGQEPEDLQQLMNRTNEKMTAADKHVAHAKELTNKVEGLKATLRQDISALKAAFATGSSGEKGESRKDPATGQSKVLSLAATVRTRVGDMVAMAKDLRTQLELAQKTQQEALQVAAELRLSRLKQSTLKKGTEGGAPSGGPRSSKDLDGFLKRLSREAQRHALDMEALRVKDGGPAAQEDLLDGLLQQLSEVLSLAEGRLTSMLQSEIPELESRMASIERLAQQLQNEKKGEAKTGQDGASLKAGGRAVRRLGEDLHRVVSDIEGTAVRVREALMTLKDLEASQTTGGMSGGQGVSSSSGRALAATAPDTPTLDELLGKAAGLVARAGKAKKGISGILQRLDALVGTGGQKDNASTLSPIATTHDKDKTGGAAGQQQQQQQQQEPRDGGVVPVAPGGSPSSPPSENISEEEYKRRSGSGVPTLYLAVGIAGGLLALLGAVGLAVYLSRKWRKAKDEESGTGTGDLQHSGELPSLSPTLDFDQLPSVLPGLHGEVAPGSASGELAKVMMMQPEVVVMGDLEAGKVMTTNRQYFVDEHHQVAKELSSQRYPKLKALGYVVSSTPTVGVPTGAAVTVTEAVPPPPRMWESAYSATGQDAAAALSAGAQQQHAGDSKKEPRQQQPQAETPVQGQHMTKSEPSPQREQRRDRKERSPSQRALELQNLEAEVERALQTQTQNQRKESPPPGRRQG